MIYERDAKGSFSFNSPTVETALHCTSMGKAVLAHLEQSEMLSVLSRLELTKKTNKTITKKKDLLNELDGIRKRGYALNDEEYLPALVAIGAPLINRDMKCPFGAISFNFFPVQNSLRKIEGKYASAVIDLAKNISDKIPSSWDAFSMF
jgi:DNA-binding IclR family transcriptional regulator